MDETFFYIVGLSLVAIALVISFVGMRSEKFPSDGVLRIGVILVAAVVIVTGIAAVNSSQLEQQEREHEENAEAAEATAEETAANEEEAGGGNASSVQEEPAEQQSGPSDDSGAGETGGAEAGAQVFVANGCGSCHSLAELPEATGAVGPNLDEALDDKDETFIRTSIVDPSAFVEEGYPDGTMPQTYESDINAEDLDALVAYLAQATSSSGSSGSGSSGSGGDSGTSK
jgi:cytoskeletal protein RodZ